MSIALGGGKPDQVPIVPIYDMGYVMHSTGRDIREWMTATAAARIEAIEENFLRHPAVDGFFVHGGTTDAWAERHAVERLDRYWRVTDLQTGESFGLLPDGSRCLPDGTAVPRQGQGIGAESRLKTPEDIERVLGARPSANASAASGRFGPLRYLAEKYPDRHFSTQTSTPMVHALNACGGYVPGLTTMASDPALYRKLLARLAEDTCALMAPAQRAGADSTWFTCFYTGADTIAPRDYAELVYPYDRMICEEARRQGLYVLNWYLGDLMPNLDKVMELPIDALVLEQGRKGYVIDPVEIRRRVGPAFCLFGFGYENDFCTFDRQRLADELSRQIGGAGRDGAFIAGTPIMPPNARPEAVEFYFSAARRLGQYGDWRAPVAEHSPALVGG